MCVYAGPVGRMLPHLFAEENAIQLGIICNNINPNNKFADYTRYGTCIDNESSKMCSKKEHRLTQKSEMLMLSIAVHKKFYAYIPTMDGTDQHESQPKRTDMPLLCMVVRVWRIKYYRWLQHKWNGFQSQVQREGAYTRSRKAENPTQEKRLAIYWIRRTVFMMIMSCCICTMHIAFHGCARARAFFHFLRFGLRWISLLSFSRFVVSLDVVYVLYCVYSTSNTEFSIRQTYEQLNTMWKHSYCIQGTWTLLRVHAEPRLKIDRPNKATQKKINKASEWLGRAVSGNRVSAGGAMHRVDCDAHAR